MIVGRDALSGRLIGLSVENGKIAALRHIEEDLDGIFPGWRRSCRSAGERVGRA